MEKYKYVILGGGTTAGFAAKAFADEGLGENELCIISAETYAPIHRPPLSKGFLTGEEEKDDIYVNKPEFYEKNKITLFLDNPATKVDFQNKTIGLEKGQQVQYEKLLIATGCEVNTLDIKGSELNGIFYLRYRTDAEVIIDAAKKSKHVLVLGGMFIGTEVAAHLSEYDIDVTLAFPNDYPLGRFATKDLGDFYTKYFTNNGIRIIHNDKAKAFEGSEIVEKVILESGEEVEADMVVAGIGVKPAVELFKDTDLELMDGCIKVNEYGETNIPDVFAAGDVTIFPDFYFKKYRHTEHWQNAHDMGTHVAKVMTGEKEPYKYLSYFFSDVFDLSWEYFGDNADADDHITRGTVDSGDFSIWWLKDDTLVAAFITGDRPDEERENARNWIENHARPNKVKLRLEEHITAAV